MAKKETKEEVYYPTGSDLLDLVVGGGKGYGFEGGHVINIVGDKSSGKTGIVMEMIAALIDKYSLKKVKHNYDDAESGNTFDTYNMYGYDLDKKRSNTVEDWYNNSREFFESLKKDEVGIFVLDSLDGLSSKEMNKRVDERYKAFKKGKDFDDGSYQMGKAKFLSQEFFPHIVPLVEDKKAFLIVISQTRDKIGSMFKTKTRAGGKALDFYCHTILWLREVCKEENKGIPTKIIIEAKTKKNKTARPFRKTKISFIFDYGIDNTGDNIDYLFNLRTDEGKLRSSAKRIQWEERKDITVKNITDFLKSNENWYKLYEEDNPTNNLKRGDKIDAVVKWIEEHKDIKSEYTKIFGVTMTRDELIDWVEKDEKRKKELTERVRDKWESVEQEIATKRTKKYSLT